MVRHAVASYNTSFMGDRGEILPFASEKHLYTNQVPPNSRQFFLNAIQNALHFWNNTPSSAIGFQEMNDQDFERKRDPSFPGGFQYITQEFQKISGNDLGVASFCVNSGPARPCLLTLWKISKLGNKLSQYGEDIIFEVRGNKQTGRPCLITLTSKNYYLINLHGPNHASESDSGMIQLRDAINRIFSAARSEFGKEISLSPFDPKKVIIMGDFNDPYNGINPGNKLKIFGHDFTFGEIRAPNSCCYNFNSTCDQSILGMLSPAQQQNPLTMYDPSQGDTLDMKPKECALVLNDSNSARDMRTGPKSLARTLGDRGALRNYKFTGDYCFTYNGNEIIQPLSIYRPRDRQYPDGVSRESDHEMVYLIFDDGFKGGSRQRRFSRTRKQQIKRTSRKVRRSRK